MANEENKRSVFAQKAEALTKELMELTEAQRGTAETGVIVIAVNRENKADHEEVILSMTGTQKLLVAALTNFAEGDDNTRSVFYDTLKFLNFKREVGPLADKLAKIISDAKADKKAETKEEE